MADPGGFDRERFLLRAVAGVFMAQFALYAAGLGGCFWLGLQQRPGPACSRYAQNLQQTFETALGTSLALLGGSSLATGRRKDPDP
ncbi:hypothetical protein [Synechococcus sp. CCY9202]|jgi:hypothetical protein|uniref:hypothetical protein n=1 Tax=Synechococcus sp. CCY9202 TaxID=174698 RepID=UPI002B1FF030|nr:hypothetical protein [Synechococcus sp. CCY9202]MEA5424733.1 hypothetical protein [Synechococcus sp. CCY9202]